MVTSREVGSVLIVGAGPTGLTLANCLVAYGVPCEVVERRAGPSRDSKALAINVMSQQSLGLVGLRGAVGRNGCVLHRLNVYWQGQRLNPVDFRRLSFPIRSFITQPQSVTEQELLTALVERGGSVHWKTGLCDFETEDDGTVKATLQSDGAPPKRRSFRYLVGCDGKNSVVRERLGIPFSGLDYPMHFVLGDFPLRWERPADHAHYFVYEDEFFIVAPVAKGLFRVVVKRDGPVPSGRTSPEEISRVVERHLGPGLFPRPPVWLSRAPFYMRTAARLQQGPVLLSGDSAHLYSPIGGTGMNTGMQDAFNLAWKLAYVLRGYGRSQALLSSYEQERLEVIRQTAAATDASTRLIARLDTELARIEPFLPRLSNRRLVAREIPHRFSGLAQRYTSSPALLDLMEGGTTVLGSVGTTCAIFPLLLAAIERRSADATPCWAMHLFTWLGEASSDDVGRLAELTSRVLKRYDSLARVFVLNPGRATASAQPICLAGASSLALDDEQVIAALTAGPALVGLVRPDGVLACVAPPSLAHQVLDFMDSFLLPQPGTATRATI